MVIITFCCIGISECLTLCTVSVTFKLFYFFFSDLELKNIIDKLANFVARNGPEFEFMTKNKQKDNPKFSFLFGGEYFNYYQYKVTTEQTSKFRGYPSSKLTIKKICMLTIKQVYNEGSLCNSHHASLP